MVCASAGNCERTQVRSSALDDEDEQEVCSAMGIADILMEGGGMDAGAFVLRFNARVKTGRSGAVYAVRSGGLGCLPFPLFAASRRMRVTRAVSWTKSPVARVPSPAITDPATRAKRNASAWSSKYKMTCPDIVFS